MTFRAVAPPGLWGESAAPEILRVIAKRLESVGWMQTSLGERYIADYPGGSRIIVVLFDVQGSPGSRKLQQVQVQFWTEQPLFDPDARPQAYLNGNGALQTKPARLTFIVDDDPKYYQKLADQIAEVPPDCFRNKAFVSPGQHAVCDYCNFQPSCLVQAITNRTAEED